MCKCHRCTCKHVPLRRALEDAKWQDALREQMLIASMDATLKACQARQVMRCQELTSYACALHHQYVQRV